MIGILLVGLGDFLVFIEEFELFVFCFGGCRLCRWKSSSRGRKVGGEGWSEVGFAGGRTVVYLLISRKFVMRYSTDGIVEATVR